MTPQEEDKSALHVIVDRIYIPSMYYHSKEASEIESEIKTRAEQFKIWANKLITEKLG